MAIGLHDAGMSEKFPSRLAEKIVVRLPDGMRDRLAAAAKVNGRSANAEVVARLERSFHEMPSSIEELRAHHAEVMEMLRQVKRVLPPGEDAEKAK